MVGFLLNTRYIGSRHLVGLLMEEETPKMDMLRVDVKFEEEEDVFGAEDRQV